MMRGAASKLLANINSMNSAKVMAANVGFWFDTPVKSLEANGEQKQSYLLFAGPKDSSVLAAYGLDRCIEYGWFEI